MNTTAIKVLPDLNLDQSDLTADPSDGKTRAPETWYVHFELHGSVEAYSASRDYLGGHGDSPMAKVSVHLPLVMIGSREDHFEDVRAAVARHAIKHLPPLS